MGLERISICSELYTPLLQGYPRPHHAGQILQIHREVAGGPGQGGGVRHGRGGRGVAQTHEQTEKR